MLAADVQLRDICNLDQKWQDSFISETVSMSMLKKQFKPQAMRLHMEHTVRVDPDSLRTWCSWQRDGCRVIEISSK